MNNPTKLLAIAATLAVIVAGVALAVSDDSSADGDTTQNASGTIRHQSFTWTYDATVKTLSISYVQPVDDDGNALYDDLGETGSLPPRNDSTPWVYLSDVVTEIHLENISNIGASAFEGFTVLKTVVNDPIDDSGTKTTITRIGAHAFDGCKGLTDVSQIITDGLVEIREGAFNNTGLSGNLTIPGSVTFIGNTVFNNTTIESVTFEETANGEKLEIGNNCFADCTQLSSVTFEGKVTPDLGTDVFKSEPKYSVPEGSEPDYEAVLKESNNTEPSINDYEAELNGVKYLLVQSAIDDAQEGDKVTVIKSEELIVMSSNIEVKRGVNISLDLNGMTLDFGDQYRILATSGSGGLKITNGSMEFGHTNPIQVMGCTLELDECTITGSGVFPDRNNNTFGTTFVYMFGSSDPSAENYSNLIIGPDCEFIYTDTTPDYGAYVVAVTYLNYGDNDSRNAYAAYGVTVDFQGKMTGNIGCAFYVNGMVKPTDGNVPKIHIAMSNDTVTGGGIYAAGYAEWDIDSCNFAADSALSIKSGSFDISGGVFHASGAFKDPADANGNGSEDTGAALSITSNSSYPQKIIVSITGGTFTSDNGYAVYEGIAKNDDGTDADDASNAAISIKGGFYEGNADKGDVMISKAAVKKVITGGSFSDDVSEYVADGYEQDGTGRIVLDTTGNVIAKIGDTEYDDLQEAVDAAASGQIVVLQADVYLDQKLVISNAGVTLDLAGKTIYASDNFTEVQTNPNTNLVEITANDVTIRNGTLSASAVNENVLNVYNVDGVVLTNLILDNTGNDSHDPLNINSSSVTLGGKMVFKPYDKENAYGIGVGCGSSTDAVCSIDFMDNTALRFMGCDYGIYIDLMQQPATSLTFGDEVIYYYDTEPFQLLLDPMEAAKETGSASDGTNPYYSVTFNVNVTGYEVVVTSSDGQTTYQPEADGVTYLLRNGSYVATFTKTGYNQEIHPFIVNGQDLNEPVNMTESGTDPEPSTKFQVSIDVFPTDAIVSISGVGVVTGTSVQLEEGSYTVSISKDGYVTQMLTIIVGEGEPNRISANLVEIEPEEPGITDPPMILGMRTTYQSGHLRL